MPYRPLVRPSGLPPNVARLIWKLERHYLTPVHAMFRMPVPNYCMVGEFQFSLAQILLGAVAGVSTTLYARSGSNGYRFLQLLINYYPFDQEPTNTVPVPDAARTLWLVFRNPLAHDLGFDLEKKAKTPEVKVLRVLTKNGTRGLTEKKIESLEDTSVRPMAKPTLAIRADATVLFVDALYWGVRCMLETLLADTNRVQSAEAFLASI